MNQFLQNFLHEACGKLKEVSRELQILSELEPFDQISARQYFRRISQHIHTIKGSAAAFGIEAVREQAHELENLLDSLGSGKIVCDVAAIVVLKAGVENIDLVLAKSLAEKDAGEMPQDLRSLLDNLTINETQQASEPDVINLPAEFLEKLNEPEKRELRQAAGDGRSVYVLAVEFPVAEFQNKLQTLRAALGQRGEIVATLPGVLTSPLLIALQIVFAATTAFTDWHEILEFFDAKILFTDQDSVSIATVATPAFLAGCRAVIELGKEVEFTLSDGNLRITEMQASVLATALLHLVTNAVAHGIELPAVRLLEGKQPSGTIQIKARQTPDSIRVSVIDDGGGINVEKIGQAAGKIYGEKPNSEEFGLGDAQKLIFQPGFSTNERLTQIAGRGVGLDAAKSAIESIGGTITVFSKIGAGTTFKIILPRT